MPKEIIVDRTFLFSEGEILRIIDIHLKRQGYKVKGIGFDINVNMSKNPVQADIFVKAVILEDQKD